MEIFALTHITHISTHKRTSIFSIKSNSYISTEQLSCKYATAQTKLRLFFAHHQQYVYLTITMYYIYIVLQYKGVIMKTELISTRIDPDMKIEFTNVCEDIGLSPSQAIKLFAKAVINYGGIPFELKGKQPNKITLQAMQELEQGKGHKGSSTSELFDEFGVNIPDV